MKIRELAVTDFLICSWKYLCNCLNVQI